MKPLILSSIEQRRSEITRLVQDLVRLPSETGNERVCQEFVAEHLRQMGLEVDTFVPEEVPGIRDHPKWIEGDYSRRPNVVGHYKGCGGGRSLLLMAHVDTVPTGPPELWRHNGPYSGALQDGKIFGRGSTDDKGELSGAIAALGAVLNCGVRLRGDVWLGSVIDEESGGGIGTLACIERGYRADAAIYCDGLDMKLQIANLGAARCLIQVRLAGPHANVDRTVERLNEIYQSVIQWRKQRQAAFAEHDFYRGTEWPGLALWTAQFQAGDEAGINLGLGQLKVFLFALPNENWDTVRANFERVVLGTGRQVGLDQESLQIRWLGQEIEPSQSDIREPLVGCMQAAFQEATSRPPVIGGQPGDDSYILRNYGRMPTVSFGFGTWGVPEGCHQVDESLSVDQQLIPFVKTLGLAILDWCGFEK